MSNIIEINNLNYKDIFLNLSLSIKENTFLTISGPNNSGKTTLMRILNRDINVNNSIKYYNREINDINLINYSQYIQLVIPKEVIFFEKTLEEELTTILKNDSKDYLYFITSNLKIKNLLNKDIRLLNDKEIILSQIAIALIHKPKLLLIDNIESYFTKKELFSLLDFLRLYQEMYGLTLILTTLDLEISLKTDHLCIINEGKVALEGLPLSILQKDNIINKIGLSLPFMIDLSVKLRDYELIDYIETNIDGMIENLWK